MNFDLTNKVILITGASRGIGGELAKAFAKEHAIVIVNYCHSENQAKEVYSVVKQYSPESVLYKADISKSDEVTLMYNGIINKFGRVDVLINNAGICSDHFIQNMSIKDWHDVIDVNLTGTFLCCKIFSEVMLKQNYGKIINIASYKGQYGSPKQINYAASKAGIIALGRSLSKELGQYNIEVNTICPGFIVTDLNRNNVEKQVSAMAKSVLPIESAMNDLINFCIFLSSTKVSGISGQVFNLDSRIL